MPVPVEEILTKYIALRDRKAELAKKQAEEIAPLSEAMGNIENYLMHIMNQMGVDQLKCADIGTAFKSRATSCQMQDAAAFKEFVFQPAVDAMVNRLHAIGVSVPNSVSKDFFIIISSMTLWDMVDFRAGKKGIQEYMENEKQPVPGVAVNTVATINVRRA